MIGQLVTIIFMLCISMGREIYADWNQELDEQTREFVKQFLEENREKYEEIYRNFSGLRKITLQDISLSRLLKILPEEKRLNLLRPREGLVIKKRQWDRITEFHVWEASLLLGKSAILPAFPVAIEGRKIILQNMETFVTGKGDEEMPQEEDIRKISLQDYWLTHLQAYILGIRDLLGRNIGIGSDGTIRLFDVEYCFFYLNSVTRGAESVNIGFLAESFDWPQYRQPLDLETLQALQPFLELLLRDLEGKLALYQAVRGVSVFNEETYDRIVALRSFTFEEGKTFRDFIAHIYPEMAPGLDELNTIVSRIYGREVDDGASLLYISQHIRHKKTAQIYKDQIANWIERYVP